MSRIFGFVSVAFICVIGICVSGAQASNERPSGHIAVDVTVRMQPRLNARAITDLETGTPVRIVPARVDGWVHIARPANGWIPSETFTRGSGDDTADTGNVADATRTGRARRPAGAGRVVRSSRAGDDTASLLLSATPGGGSQERSESDLMAAALGDSPNAARIARVVTQTTIESRKNRAAIESSSSVWKDPFAEDSAPPVPVSPRRRARALNVAMRSAPVESAPPADPQLSELRAARREIARVRAEAVAARADAQAARAAAERGGCDVAAPVRRPPIARAAWRDAGLSDGGGRVERPRPTKEPSQDLRKVARVASERRPTSRSAVFSERAPAPPAEERAPTSWPPAPTVAAPAPPAAAPPAPPPGNEAWTKGILVVPITPLKRPTR